MSRIVVLTKPEPANQFGKPGPGVCDSLWGTCPPDVQFPLPPAGYVRNIYSGQLFLATIRLPQGIYVDSNGNQITVAGWDGPPAWSGGTLPNWPPGKQPPFAGGGPRFWIPQPPVVTTPATPTTTTTTTEPAPVEDLYFGLSPWTWAGIAAGVGGLFLVFMNMPSGGKS